MRDEITVVIEREVMLAAMKNIADIPPLTKGIKIVKPQLWAYP